MTRKEEKDPLKYVHFPAQKCVIPEWLYDGIRVADMNYRIEIVCKLARWLVVLVSELATTSYKSLHVASVGLKDVSG